MDEAIPLEANQVLVSLSETTDALDHIASISFVGACGIVEEVGHDLTGTLEKGHTVMMLIPAEQTKRSKIPLDETILCIKPPELAPKQAATIAASYILAHDAAQAYEHALRRSTSVINSGSSVPGVSILVTGGETTTSAILCLLLKAAHPYAQIFVMVDLTEHDDLVKRVGQYVLSFRAHYAIDANATDTVQHVEAGLEGYTGRKKFDGLIDVTGFAQKVPDVMSILEEEHVFVDATAVPIGDPKEIMDSLRSFIDSNASCLIEL
ncbi:unnamed protein product [Cercospora beticola]|nr:unnamed protein product [Cercospora beticola]